MNATIRSIKPYLSIILLAIALRFLLMPFLYHPDIKIIYFQAQYFGQGISNIYTYIIENSASLPYKEQYAYPPLIYYITGIWEWLMSPLLAKDFFSWLNYAGPQPFEKYTIFRYLFILKIPIFLGDIATGLLLTRLVKDQSRKTVLLLWFFNPITLYIIYGLSNIDIIPTFLMVLAVYFLHKMQYVKAGISLGLGVATKIYPILFIPFICLSLLFAKRLRQAVLLGIVTAVVSLLSIAFVYQDIFLLGNTGLLQKVLTPTLSMGGVTIPVFYVMYALLLTIAALKPLSTYRLACLISLFIFMLAALTKIHPQWLLWGLPFFCIIAAQNKKLLIPFCLFLVGYFMMIFSFQDKFLLFGIVSPALPSVSESVQFEETLFNMVPFGVIQTLAKFSIILAVLAMVIMNVKAYIYDE